MKDTLWDALRREYWFPLALALLFTLLGTAPYLYAYAIAAPDERFMGFVGRGTLALNSYLTLPRQIAEGHHLIENFMTSEPLKRNYFHPEWWLYGQFARWTGLSMVQTFHVWRVAGVFLFVGAVYFLCAVCFTSVYLRRLATALIVLGSGLGWVIWLLNKCFGFSLPLPLDLDGVTIAGYLVNNPHFIRAGIFSALQYAFLILGEQTGRRKYYFWSGIMAAGNTMIRPHHLPETYAIYLIYPALRAVQEKRIDWNRIKNHALAATVQLPMLLLHIHTVVLNPLGIAGWIRQSEFLLPMTLWLGLPFGLVCIYFMLKGFAHIPQARPETLMMGSWLFISWLQVQAFPYVAWAHEGFYPFMYAPVILALSGPLPCLVDEVRRRFGNKVSFDKSAWRFAAASLLVAVSMPSTIYVYADFFVRLHHPKPTWRYYLPEHTLSAIDWLKKNAADGEVVLSSIDTGQFIPRLYDVKVFIAQDLLTANFNEKIGIVYRFYQNKEDDLFKRWIVEQYNIRYVFFGPFEHFPNGMDPDEHPWLEPVFSQGETMVYRVR